jgi:hypothetical protein
VGDVVDPSLPPKPEPTKEELSFVGGMACGGEERHQIFYPLMI